jgi:hypothetical protein
MSIWQGDRRGGGFGGDFDDFSSASFGGNRRNHATDEQLTELVENMASAARVVPGSSQKVGSTRVNTKIDINGSEYDVKIDADGSFVAKRTDGVVEIKLIHDTKTYGAPLKFVYTNNNSPDQSGETRDGVTCAKAQEMGRKLFKAATKKSSLDI